MVVRWTCRIHGRRWNCGQEWLGDADIAQIMARLPLPHRRTRSYFYECESAFVDITGSRLAGCFSHGDRRPPLEPVGTEIAQVFKSSVSEASESVRFMYLLSIACATRHVRIASAYFVPDALSVATIVAASRRGVTVEIIVPGGHTDATVVRRASRSRWGRFRKPGVSIYECQPTMFHTKVLDCSGRRVDIGRIHQLHDSQSLSSKRVGANLNVPGCALRARHRRGRSIPTNSLRSRSHSMLGSAARLKRN